MILCQMNRGDFEQMLVTADRALALLKAPHEQAHFAALKAGALYEMERLTALPGGRRRRQGCAPARGRRSALCLATEGFAHPHCVRGPCPEIQKRAVVRESAA